MSRPLAALAAAGLAALALAAPAAAAPPDLADHQDRESVLLAYGEGVTECTVQVEKNTPWLAIEYPRWNFGGTTSCNAAVQQSGQARLGTTYTAPLCSGLRTTCTSIAGGTGNGPMAGTVTYDVTLTAPLGQGWVAAPSHCAGVGTDWLTCRFVVEIAAGI
jgi:hypothetical protein